MPTILWLDDQPIHIKDAVADLNKKGYDIEVVQTDQEAIHRLETKQLPNIFIQDLRRPGEKTKFLFSKKPSRYFNTEVAGWAFYREVLSVKYPQLPVIIVTLDGDDVSNQQTANDFNLQIIRKGPSLSNDLGFALSNLINAQHLILPTQTLPAIVHVDFKKINRALISHLAKNPQDLDNITWANFEELIAVLLRDLGYEVSHTKLTRDGGVDLWALQRSDLGSTLYAIDAKKYSRSKVIGPEPVRAIYGVASLEKASVGMIITTATFGPAARQLATQYRYRISLKDFDDVVAWLRKVGGQR
jgi:CheY-like chemotaxis protein